MRTIEEVAAQMPNSTVGHLCSFWIMLDQNLTHPQQVVLGHAGRDVVEVEHGGGRLDDVFGGLAGAAEAVVARHGEVLVAAAAVLQLKHLAGDH